MFGLRWKLQNLVDIWLHPKESLPSKVVSLVRDPA